MYTFTHTQCNWKQHGLGPKVTTLLFTVSPSGDAADMLPPVLVEDIRLESAVSSD